MRRLALTALLVAVAGTAVWIALVRSLQPSSAGRSPPARPNILIIVTDDQRADGTMEVMPRTSFWFASGGTRFERAFATTPLCCPSRASILSGRYAHNHRVHTTGDAEALDQGSTIERYLHEAGYRTGIFGKFLNQWDLDVDPPWFDRWAIFEAGYLNARFNLDGRRATVPEHSTRFLQDRTVEFLRQAESNDAEPWFAYVAPFAPHGPRTPEPKYAEAAVPPFAPDPRLSEENRSDKPGYVRSQRTTAARVEEIRTGQLRTLMSVDDLVDTILRTMQQLGERDTLAFYLSDNGYLWGEHGLVDKTYPYGPSVRIPLFLRWPGHVTAGAVDDRLAATIDLAPTILDAAGSTAAPAFPADGRSLLDAAARDRLLLEYWRDPILSDRFPPTWASTWTDSYQYVEYVKADGRTVLFREYYDLRSDPLALTNLLANGDRNDNPNVEALHDRLAADRLCAGAGCP